MKLSTILYNSLLSSVALAVAINGETTTRKVARAGKLKWLGVNEAGPEFSPNTLPGTENKNYVFPSTATINQLIGEGYNIFRVPFLMERMVPNTLNGAPAATYLTKYTAVINSITNNGAYAVIDAHNYGRYYNNIITDSAGFQAFWKTVASQFANNTKVIFDTNNEFHDEDQTNVFNMNQAAINGIRAAGATSQYIFVEGNGWSGAGSWSSVNDNLKNLQDPQNKLVYEMHTYLDSDGSGTSSNCVSSTIGVDKVTGATNWLRQNKKLGVIGEMAGGNNAQCQTAVKGLLDHLESNADVWQGFLWWAAGPWWGNYMFSFEPPSGTGYVNYNSILKAYKP